jgi:hypothetical protein
VNAVEIEEAISNLAEQPFNAEEFPFEFLEAFGNKPTTIRRLKSGSNNKSDIDGGVLQRNNLHIATCAEGEVADTLKKLKESPETKKAKAKFIVATDGKQFEAEDLISDDAPIVCEFKFFPDHFGFFLPLAGISTVKAIRENSIDIKATGRLNRLYIQLLKDNPSWGTAERRHDMNHFMSRLIFCFFAEDTDIFNGDGLFTSTIDQMSERDSSNTHEVMSEVFRAMDTKIEDRASSSLHRWADQFPYVNGGLFSGSTQTPKFSKIARSYLVHIGNLDWTKINPDIFGSMIQAVTDEEERSSLGLHYTSVPNILKVLNPLFLDVFRKKLEEAGDSQIKLLNLRKRLSRIRVFDPACGSGNFLVIAYKEMRALESKINIKRGEEALKTEIPLTNFRGIELRDFPAEIARLALIIAEYQCDVLYRGQKEALAEFLPLNAMNWIVQGNALQLDWLSVCPPVGVGVKLQADDLFETPLDQAEIDFENEGGETYICGNPPYIGRRNQDKNQKSDIKKLLAKKIKSSASLDYVFGWIEKASDYVINCEGEFAFVTTNSISQGSQVPIYWPYLYSKGLEINFAHQSFRWNNNASNNAGVTCVIVGVGKSRVKKTIFMVGDQAQIVKKINPYLLPSDVEAVSSRSIAISQIAKMSYGNLPGDGNFLTLSNEEKKSLIRDDPWLKKIILPLYGAQEFIRGLQRFCLWIDDCDLVRAKSNPFIANRIKMVLDTRLNSKDASYNSLANRPHQFRDRNLASKTTILTPTVSSESREYLPATLFPGRTATTNQAFAIYDGDLWNLSIIVSQLHISWIGLVCGKLETRYRYSNTLGWNTFPVPMLTEKNKLDLTICAENILLARESNFPATIADLYDPEKMPENLRKAHEKNDETLERIYIGRRFKNETERLEKLFDLYTKMVEKNKPTIKNLRKESK